MTPEDPVEVYSATDAPEAHFVCNLLADAGIEAMVVDADLGATVTGVPQLATPRVWVHSADAERARSLIEEYQEHIIDRVESQYEGEDSATADPASTAEPFCYHCGQPVSQGQSPCPACGKELDWSNKPEAEDVP